MELAGYQIRKQIKAHLIRKYRGGLIKKKTRAERVFEDILKRLGMNYIFQAGFLTPMSFYIVDFYIKSPHKLIIEIDGKSHKQTKRILYDKEKIKYLRRCGFKVLNFTNDAVLNQTPEVERQLCSCLNK